MSAMDDGWRGVNGSLNLIYLYTACRSCLGMNHIVPSIDRRWGMNLVIKAWVMPHGNLGHRMLVACGLFGCNPMLGHVARGIR